MFMYINKGRHDQTAPGVNKLCIRICVSDVFLIPYSADYGSVNRYRAILNQGT